MITVVVAVYNKERFIKKCIESILSQTVSAAEIIIIDDGSTDSSISIINSFSKYAEIKIIKQENFGPGKARNVGLEICNTKWITFIDADDFWEPTFIETGLRKLEENLSCNVFLCAANWISEDSDVVRLPTYSFEKNPKEGSWSIQDNLNANDLVTSMDFFATGAVIARTSVLKNYGGYFDMKFCNSGEDGYLWIQVMFNNLIYRSLTPLVNINITGSQLGIRRGARKPTPPSLIYSEKLFDNVIENRTNDLSLLLNILAFRSFRLRVYDFQFIQAYKLLKKFPDLKINKPDDYPNIPWAFIKIPFNRCITKPLLAINFFNYGK